MDIKDYDEKIVLAFQCGGGGLYCREYYNEAVRGNENLTDVVEDIKSDMRLDLEDEDDGTKRKYERLLEIMPHNLDACLSFFEDYLEGRKESHPELCGTIAGIMFRHGERKRVLEFLEVSDLSEYRYWDS